MFAKLIPTYSLKSQRVLNSSLVLPLTYFLTLILRDNDVQLSLLFLWHLLSCFYYHYYSFVHLLVKFSYHLLMGRVMRI